MNEILVNQIIEILKEENQLAALCNATALIKMATKDINWVGYYFYKNQSLHLGPFQGKPACTKIKVGEGVCGTAFERNMLLNIADVHRFAGHIACDQDSNSELVIPLLYNNRRVGVLDIDSPIYRRFTYDDEETFQEIANLIAKKIAG